MWEQTVGLNRNKKTMLAIIGFLLIPFIGLTDYLTGYELTFSIFYLLPIMLLTWMAGETAGITASVASGVVWFYMDFLAGHKYSSFLIPYWNAFARFGFFIIISLLLASLKRGMLSERERADTDSLTGISNSRAFYGVLQTEMQRTRRYRHPFSVVYLDVDNFKFVNDSLGHNTGDDLLCLAANIIKDELRDTDTAGRIGAATSSLCFCPRRTRRAPS